LIEAISAIQTKRGSPLRRLKVRVDRPIGGGADRLKYIHPTVDREAAQPTDVSSCDLQKATNLIEEHEMNLSIPVLFVALICLAAASAFPQLRQRNEKQVQTGDDDLRK